MKRIAEKDLTFRARKSDKVIFPIDKKNVSNNKMSKKVRSEAELNKLIMDKYGEKLRAEGLTTKSTTLGERIRLQNKSKVKAVIGDNLFAEFEQARRERKGAKAPDTRPASKATRKAREPTAKQKSKMPEDEIVGILLKKYPSLNRFKVGTRLAVRGDKAKQIMAIIDNPDDEKLYLEMVDEREKRKIQEGKGVRKPKVKVSGENIREGIAKERVGGAKRRKQAAPKMNAKTVPQKLARQSLIQGKDTARAALVSGTDLPSAEMPSGRPYAKRNIRRGARGALMLYT